MYYVITPLIIFAMFNRTKGLVKAVHDKNNHAIKGEVLFMILTLIVIILVFYLIDIFNLA